MLKRHSDSVKSILDEATEKGRRVSSKRLRQHAPISVDLDSLLLAVWSPRGSNGRSTLAAALAHTFAKSGGSISPAGWSGGSAKSDEAAAASRVLLVDADTYSPAQHVIHGANEITAGILAASRLVRQERYTEQEHERVTLPMAGYRLMTGLTAADRWPEIDDHASSLLIHDLSQRAAISIFDLPSEIDAGLVEPSLGTRRNQLSLSVLQRADVVLAIANADQVSISRLVQGLPRLFELVNGRVIVVINRMRTTAIGQNAKRQILEVLSNQINSTPMDVVFVPDDPRACDEALLAGEPVTAHRNRSAFAKGIRELASRINSTHVHTARAG